MYLFSWQYARTSICNVSLLIILPFTPLHKNGINEKKENRGGFRMFINRTDAAKQLEEKVKHLKEVTQPLVLAIPRGGLPIGAHIASFLGAPLDILLTKKIGAPFNPEFAIGAVTPDSYFVNVQYDNPDYQQYIEQEVSKLQSLLKKRGELYRQNKPAHNLTGKTIIIVDDGVATGRTLLAAVQSIKKQKPHRIIIVTPVIPPEAQQMLSEHVDEVISILIPNYLGAIGEFYQDFSPVSDDEAMKIFQAFGDHS